ncbi:hypothetical protein SAMN05660649_00279 [Desulfotomaculum arcticum]|uniref:Uncharacterized protein n=1 Tax=Desulfotruncus arcticus DSM 17038 TaxID=1121424 RepID=A0A1I2N2S6_9FIRM|nr:UPF0280 family protein [Desulfotruncus arcticus]SFF97400.1 hypothetical protein SAMN05660649_00279 [Desulfotomaculum arcticum] [Desulfotruncus arcticus DSM 17038]
MTDYVNRTYRLLHNQKDLSFFRVTVQETDLDIGLPGGIITPSLIEGIRKEIITSRSQIEGYINENELFLTTLKPFPVSKDAPELVRIMAEAGNTAGIGPMSAVAGSIAHHVGAYLSRRSSEVIVENGGDIYLRSGRLRKIGIFAGPSPFTNKLAIEIEPHLTPLGICTSSGTVGHSLSFGRADAVVVLAPSAALADAVATATGNLVQSESDLQSAVDFAMGIKSVTGAMVIKNDKLAAAGNIQLAPM